MHSLKNLFVLIIGFSFVYILGRLYFAVTAGFMLDNILSDIDIKKNWQASAPSFEETKQVFKALDQEYTYLSKGCQSYVFGSEDGEYVIKFIKFQRFRQQPWLKLVDGVPLLKDYKWKKSKEKKMRLDKLFTSWQLAYKYLKDETGVVFVHLNETSEWQKPLIIRDKVGFKYSLNLDKMQFLLQRRAQMLSSTLTRYMEEGNEKDAKLLIDRLMEMLLFEYMRGFADNDHALMQNTGVLNGRPIHIDAGQFIFNPQLLNEEVIKREIYDKTFNFAKWLQKQHPSLAEHLKTRLLSLIGIDYYSMLPYTHKGDVNKIPHIAHP